MCEKDDRNVVSVENKMRVICITPDVLRAGAEILMPIGGGDFFLPNDPFAFDLAKKVFLAMHKKAMEQAQG